MIQHVGINRGWSSPTDWWFMDGGIWWPRASVMDGYIWRWRNGALQKQILLTQDLDVTIDITCHDTHFPTQQPTQQPTEPTHNPTEQPTQQPTEQPTEQPTQQPTEQPTSEFRWNTFDTLPIKNIENLTNRATNATAYLGSHRNVHLADCEGLAYCFELVYSMNKQCFRAINSFRWVSPLLFWRPQAKRQSFSIGKPWFPPCVSFPLHFFQQGEDSTQWVDTLPECISSCIRCV